MFGRVISAWLVFLTLTPFTAPFPTCDLTTFLTEGAPAPANGTSAATSLADASLSQALPLFRASARVRFIALAESKTASEGPPLSAAAFTQLLRPVSSTSHRIDSAILRI